MIIFFDRDRHRGCSCDCYLQEGFAAPFPPSNPRKRNLLGRTAQSWVHPTCKQSFESHFRARFPQTPAATSDIVFGLPTGQITSCSEFHTTLLKFWLTVRPMPVGQSLRRRDPKICRARAVSSAGCWIKSLVLPKTRLFMEQGSECSRLKWDVGLQAPSKNKAARVSGRKFLSKAGAAVSRLNERPTIASCQRLKKRLFLSTPS